MISFFYNTPDVPVSYEKQFEIVCNKIIEDFKLEADYINIIFMNDEELLEINKQFLNHDYYTDIITFNYSEEENGVEAELYISYDRVKENASTLNIDADKELARVIIHGVLHLAGYEDSTPELKTNMREKEDYYLNTLQFHVKQQVINN